MVSTLLISLIFNPMFYTHTYMSLNQIYFLMIYFLLFLSLMIYINLWFNQIDFQKSNHANI